MSPRAQYAAITAIKEALAQPEQKRPQNCGSGFCSCIKCVMEPEQEPVAVVGGNRKGWFYLEGKPAVVIGMSLYATPQARKWIGLTNAEWSDLYEAHYDKYNLPKQGSPDGMDYERAIEALLKERNHD